MTYGWQNCNFRRTVDWFLDKNGSKFLQFGGFKSYWESSYPQFSFSRREPEVWRSGHFRPPSRERLGPEGPRTHEYSESQVCYPGDIKETWQCSGTVVCVSTERRQAEPMWRELPMEWQLLPQELLQKMWDSQHSGLKCPHSGLNCQRSGLNCQIEFLTFCIELCSPQMYLLKS